MNTKGKESVDCSMQHQQITHSGDSDSIKVFVRVRPLTQGTGLTTDGDQGLCLTVTSPNTIRLHSKPEPRTFTYDHVADMDITQDSVFSSVAKNIVESCINGYNGTIFAYGQTGSGKTFTMLGPSDFDNFTDDQRGVIPRSFEYLFFLINRESENAKSFLCKCSFIEIYNEQIYDLLDSASASLFLRENIKKGVFVEGAVEKFVTSAAEAYQVLSMGWRNRRVASTSMNRESSRSHAVFTMTLESKETAKEVVNIRTSQLNLVDLAGSERQRDTHTEGSRLKEASSINRSLMCLGQVIMALVDVSNGKSRHICYRDSKLTFLLRDSLGGNAKTYIIANVHPGSKCFGETLSTLQFAQRAKLIKNKAMINEDTQGNVRQLQTEVKKLKEQLAQALFAQTHSGGDMAPGGLDASYKTQFLEAVRLWKKCENDKQMLLQKVAQLEEAWSQKEKFIHSNRMILKFREEHISRLEKSLKGGQGLLSDPQSQALVDQLKDEIKILRDQIAHHPKMTRYAAENYSLREENRQLRSLESVRRAKEAAGQAAAELEEEFQRALETEWSAGGKHRRSQLSYSTPVTAENISAISMERLKAQFLQKQTELTATIQAFEEYKELTKKQMSELESETRYLDKSNKHLENILEATKAHKKLEVSQLNKIHFETIKILTTPTKAYNLRTRLVPLSSPDHLNVNGRGDEDLDDIQSEQPPPAMTEMACEALTEELQQVQVQHAGLITYKTDNVILLILLVESTNLFPFCLAGLLSTERSGWNREQLSLQETISNLEQNLQAERRTREVLKSEVHDLRLVLQSSDRELAAVKKELCEGQSEQQKETSHLSSSLISTQLQLQEVQREWEQLLEQQRSLQDAFDQLQAEAKFDADQSRQQLEEKRQEVTAQQELTNALQSEREHTSNLTSQLKEDKESTLEKLVQTMEQNAVLRKQVSDLTTQSQQQVCFSSLVFRVYMVGYYSALELSRSFQFFFLEILILLISQTPHTPRSFNTDLSQVLECQERELENRRSSMLTMEVLLTELNSERAAKNEEIQRLKVGFFCLRDVMMNCEGGKCLYLPDCPLQEVEVLRKQVDHLSEENGKLVGHKNHKQRIEYLVKLKKENTKLQEVIIIFNISSHENEKLRSEMSVRENA
uniref:Kinesin motor domain-containing protein n=1 Tax=Oncorhynchus tshawytscha TaxID=74940 RepID=A0A8C8CQ03_ONCTS